MLKLNFCKGVIFFFEKYFNTPKVETLRMAHRLCLSILNLINQRNVSHIELSKYCDTDARLILFTIIVYFMHLVSLTSWQLNINLYDIYSACLIILSMTANFYSINSKLN